MFNVPDSSAASSCSSYLGRDCVVNNLSGSGDFGSYTDTSVLKALANSVIDASSADGVAASVQANAGVGKLSGSASTTSKSKTTVSSSVPIGTGSVASYAPVGTGTAVSYAPVGTGTAVSYASVGTGTAASSAPSSMGSQTSVVAVAKYGQCGGLGYQGPTTCVGGTACKVYDDYYSQCE